MKKEFLANTLALLNYGAILTVPQPALAQEILDPDTTKTGYARHDIPDPVVIQSILGSASLLVERICETDGAGRIEISLYSNGLGSGGGALLLEAKPILGNRVLDSMAAQVELKSPERQAKITLSKDKPFMVYLREKIGQTARTIKSFDVAHYCRPILLVNPPTYERSPDFQEQNLNLEKLEDDEESLEEII